MPGIKENQRGQIILNPRALHAIPAFAGMTI